MPYDWSRDKKLLGGLVFLFAVGFFVGLLSGLNANQEKFKAFEDLKEQGIIVKMCSTPLDEPHNENCSFELQPFSGFWINDIYNTCTYVAPDGNRLFDGYCYETLEEPNQVLEACKTGCILGSSTLKDQSECLSLCEESNAFGLKQEKDNV